MDNIICEVCGLVLRLPSEVQEWCEPCVNSQIDYEEDVRYVELVIRRKLRGYYE